MKRLFFYLLTFVVVFGRVATAATNTISGTATLSANDASVLTGNDISFTGSGGVLTIDSADKTLNKISSDQNDGSTIRFNGAHTLSVTSSVGTSSVTSGDAGSGKGIKVEFLSDGVLNAKADSFLGAVTTNGGSAGTGTIIFSTQRFVHNSSTGGSLGASDNKLKEIIVGGTVFSSSVKGEFTANFYDSVYTKKTTIKNNSTLTTYIDQATFDLGNVSIEDGSSLNIMVRAEVAGATTRPTFSALNTAGGKVLFRFDSTATEVGYVKFSGASVIDSKLEFRMKNGVIPYVLGNASATLDLSKVSSITVNTKTDSSAFAYNTAYKIFDFSASGASITTPSDLGTIGVSTDQKTLFFVPRLTSNVLYLDSYKKDADLDYITMASGASPGASTMLSQLKNQLYAIAGNQVALRKANESIAPSAANNPSSFLFSNKVGELIGDRAQDVFAGSRGISAGNAGSNQSFGTWGKIFGGKLSQDSSSSQEGYSADLYGGVVGFDTTIDDNIQSLFGTSLSFGNYSISSKKAGSQNTDVSSYQISLYNRNVFNKSGEGFYNEEVISYGINQYKTRRTIQVGSFSATPTANFDGNQYSGKIGIGYNKKFFKNLLFTPNTYFEYQRLSQDAYTETGAGNAGFKVSTKDTETKIVGTGFKLSSNIKAGNFRIIPKFDFSWMRNFQKKGQEMTVTFIAGGQSTTSVGNSLLANSFNIGTELELASFTNSSFKLRYDAKVGSGFMGHIGSLSYRKLF